MFLCLCLLMLGMYLPSGWQRVPVPHPLALAVQVSYEPAGMAAGN